MKTNKLLILSIGALLVIGCCIVGGVSAEEQNLTVLESLNVTNATNSSITQIDYSDWYKTTNESEFYLPYLDAVNGTLQPSITKQDVIDCLFQDKSDEDLHNDELVLMGYTDKLERFINAEKVYLEDTGEWAIKYDYSFWDNIFSFFGNKPDVYTDYYEGKLAEMQYKVNTANLWCGEQSKHLLLIDEETIDE